jgi:hypothetical protein
MPTEQYVEKTTFTRASSSYIRVTMMIMFVPLVELLCQTVIGQIAALE